MSVRSPGRAGETADSHGQRPYKPATRTFTWLLAWDGPAGASIEAAMIPHRRPARTPTRNDSHPSRPAPPRQMCAYPGRNSRRRPGPSQPPSAPQGVLAAVAGIVVLFPVLALLIPEIRHMQRANLAPSRSSGRVSGWPATASPGRQPVGGQRRGGGGGVRAGPGGLRAVGDPAWSAYPAGLTCTTGSGSTPAHAAVCDQAAAASPTLASLWKSRPPAPSPARFTSCPASAPGTASTLPFTWRAGTWFRGWLVRSTDAEVCTRWPGRRSGRVDRCRNVECRCRQAASGHVAGGRRRTLLFRRSLRVSRGWT